MNINYLIYDKNTFKVIQELAFFDQEATQTVVSDPQKSWVGIWNKATKNILEKINEVNNTNYR
jgi:hypothetical protein